MRTDPKHTMSISNIVEVIKFEYTYDGGQTSYLDVVGNLLSFKIQLVSKRDVFVLKDLKVCDSLRRTDYLMVLSIVVQANVDESDTHRWCRWTTNLNKVFASARKEEGQKLHIVNGMGMITDKPTYKGEILLLGPPTLYDEELQVPVIDKRCMINTTDDDFTDPTSKLFDIEFISSSGERVKACKSLLATVSPAFNKMFCSDFKKLSEIHLEDYDTRAVRMLVEYSIRRVYDPKETDYEFVMLCSEYLIKTVVDKWCRLMTTSIDHVNAVDVMLLARLLNSERLVNTAKRCIKNNSAKIKDLDKLDRDDLIDILTTR